MVGYDKYSDKLSSSDYAIAGALSGFVTRALCQPFDVVKIRFQLQVEPIKKDPLSKYHSLPQAFVRIYKEEGWKAFWKGHVPAQMLSVVFGLTQFWVFEQLTKQDFVKNNKGYYMNFICGSIGGTAATIVSFPFDVVRTRLVAQSEKHKAYKGTLDAFVKIFLYDSKVVYFRGLLPTLLQVAPHAGVQFMTYNIVDKMYRNLSNLDDKTYTFTSSIISGAFAGLIAKTAVYPFDLMRKRLQIQGFSKHREGFGKHITGKNLRECFSNTIRYEGILGLFKGLSPSLFKAVVTSAMHFASYEMICKSIEVYRS